MSNNISNGVVVSGATMPIVGGAGQVTVNGTGNTVSWNAITMPHPKTLKLFDILSKLGIKSCKQWDPYQQRSKWYYSVSAIQADGRAVNWSNGVLTKVEP